MEEARPAAVRPDEDDKPRQIPAEEVRRLVAEGRELRKKILQHADAASRITSSDLRVRAR